MCAPFVLFGRIRSPKDLSAFAAAQTGTCRVLFAMDTFHVSLLVFLGVSCGRQYTGHHAFVDRVHAYLPVKT